MIAGVGGYRGGQSGGYARVHLQCPQPEADYCVRVELDDDGWNAQLRDGSFTG